MKKLFLPADILLPAKADMQLWSVIACDQFSAQPEYWDAVDEKVGEAPSTLRLMLPEAYLDTKDTAEETEKINRTMKNYLENGVFKEVENSFVYVERDMTVGAKRQGLVGVIDLEEYDYSVDSVSPVHATEGTVESRLPARVKVREGACIELPHIVVFIDDPENIVFGNIDCGETLYEFDLMDGGGHIVGRRVSGTGAEKVLENLDELAQPDYLESRYCLNGKSPVVIAMGDGNHSLATAKLCWEQMKISLSPDERENHPARYGLAELVNIHDASVVFEPIHRVIFETETEDFMAAAKKYFEQKSLPGTTAHEIRLVCGNSTQTVTLTGHTIGRTIAEAQSFCLEYMAAHGGKIDYIHDDDTAAKMASRNGCAGLLLPPMNKNELFQSIMESGVFPAKSFSIGPARDKRYYLECRKIK